MVTVANRCQAWVDLVCEYLRGPAAPFPVAALGHGLTASFPCVLVSWNQGNTCEHRHQISLAQTIDDWPTSDELAGAAELMKVHPLLCWYEISQDPKPFDIRSVPREAIPRVGPGLVTEMLSHVGVDHQLAIPVYLSGGEYRTFVLGRPDDFTDEELELARCIQPLLSLALRQSWAISRPPSAKVGSGPSGSGRDVWSPASSAWGWTLRLSPEGNDRDGAAHLAGAAAAATASDLTGRELAVLSLLAEGGTAHRIGRQLGISPRTVHTHLGRIYRKLEVDGRITALIEARRRGILF